VIQTRLKYYDERVLWLNIAGEDLRNFLKPGDLHLKFVPISALDPAWKALPEIVRRFKSPFLPGHAKAITRWLSHGDPGIVVWCRDWVLASAFLYALQTTGYWPKTTESRYVAEYGFILSMFNYLSLGRRIPKNQNERQAVRVRDVEAGAPTGGILRNLRFPQMREDPRPPDVRPRDVPVRRRGQLA
jgi:hypothetical protein